MFTRKSNKYFPLNFLDAIASLDLCLFKVYLKYYIDLNNFKHLNTFNPMTMLMCPSVRNGSLKVS